MFAVFEKRALRRLVFAVSVLGSRSKGFIFAVGQGEAGPVGDGLRGSGGSQTRRRHGVCDVERIIQCDGSLPNRNGVIVFAGE